MNHSPDDPVFGADGGGTKTAGVILGEGDKVLAECLGGPGNPNVVGVPEAAKTLAGLLTAACRDAGISPGDLQAAVFGLAGVGSPAIRQKLREALHGEFRKSGAGVRRFELETDARIALEGAFGGGPGIVVIAGTGSIVLGKTSDGRVDRVGGWGRLIGDEGSGFRIGLEAIKAVARDMDGRGLATVLRGLFHERFGWEKREDIITAVYQQDFAVPSLAPVVLGAADSGDRTAAGILEREAADLAGQVGALAGRIGGPPPHGVVFTGGLIEHDTSYARIFRTVLERDVPGIAVRPPGHSPVYGAALMARALRGEGS